MHANKEQPSVGVESTESSESSATRFHAVTQDESGLRLDRWFKKKFPDLSHGSLQKLLRTGQVRVDKKRAQADDRLAEGQLIRLPPQLANLQEKEVSGGEGASRSKGQGLQNRAQAKRASQLLDLVLYQDDDVIALNKPAGLAVQGGTGLRENLDDMLMVFSRDGTTKPKLVHRLDRETSGVLLVARTDFAARRLTEAFRMRDTQKIYWAATCGVPRPTQGKIEAALLKQGETMVVVPPKTPDAKTAATLYKVVENATREMAFVALWPLTGRTHQLRVHMAHIGTPILGDKLYGGLCPETLPAKELGSGLHLHARRLLIPHPRRGLIDVTAPLGPQMKKTWNWFHFDAQAEVDFSDV